MVFSSVCQKRIDLIYSTNKFNKSIIHLTHECKIFQKLVLGHRVMKCNGESSCIKLGIEVNKEITDLLSGKGTGQT